MKRPYPVLARHSGNLLKGIHNLGLCTDLSLAAAVVGAGESPIDRSTFVRWRDGESCAPLGLLPVLLSHVDDPAEVLGLLAEPLGLQVLPMGDLDTDERTLSDRALELTELVGKVTAEVRQTLADGRADPDEFERIRAVAASLRKAAASLEAVSGEAAQLRTVPR